MRSLASILPALQNRQRSTASVGRPCLDHQHLFVCDPILIVYKKAQTSSQDFVLSQPLPDPSVVPGLTETIFIL